MQRFQCLFEARSQSLRSLRQLNHHGQISKFSTFKASPYRVAIPHRPQPLHDSQSLNTPLISLLSPSSRRFISNSTTAAESSTPISSQPVDEFLPTDTPFPIDPYANPTTDNIFNIEPHIGYLKELGLDYGIGPTTLVETLLEYAYVYGPFGWTGTVVGTVLAFRLFMFKFARESADMGARMRATKDLTKDVDLKLKEATYSGDKMQRALAIQEKKMIYQTAGIKISKIFTNMAISFPIGFGTFRIMRGMASVPVPGLETGGFLWVMDLSAPDPFFVLPTLAAFTIYRSFALVTKSTAGGEQPKSTQILLQYILPGAMFLFGMQFPAILQLTMLTTAAAQNLQAWLFLQPGMRQFLNMYPLPEQTAPPAPKVLNVKGKVVDGPPPKPKEFVPRLKWHFSQAASEIVKKRDEVFPQQSKKPEQQKKGPRRRV